MTPNLVQQWKFLEDTNIVKIAIINNYYQITNKIIKKANFNAFNYAETKNGLFY